MKKSIYDWVIETLTTLCLLWSFYPFCFYSKFTGPVPIHYNALGQVDIWGNRSFFWLLPLLSLTFYIGISISEKYYSKFNYPIKVTEKNANSLYKLALGLLRHMKFAGEKSPASRRNMPQQRSTSEHPRPPHILRPYRPPRLT